MHKDDLIKKLESMKGRTFEYKNEKHTILNYRIKNYEEFEICTDKEWFTRTIMEASIFLNNFFPDVEGERISAQVQVFHNSVNTIDKVKNILMETIEKVKNDKSYVPQATAINNQINRMVNITKIQLQMSKQK